MKVSRLLVVLVLFVAVGFFFREPGSRGLLYPKVIVLGFDGMDPNLLTRFMEEGKLPNFSRLRETGSFRELLSTNPPQSPVAWSSFTTGNNPGRNNIFDFLTRDAKTYIPKLTIAEVEEPKTLSIGSYRIPMAEAKVTAYRKGTPFWELAEQHGIPTVTLLVPVTFPPDPHGRILSGMGVPDLLGTNGTFSFYTTEPQRDTGQPVGGKIYPVSVQNNRIESVITGPRNSFRKDQPNVQVPFTVDLQGTDGVAIHVQDHDIFLKDREWSDWTRIRFKLAPFVDVTGICRFYLVGRSPEFSLYLTPINVDPENPSLPISNPPEYVEELSHLFGMFYTQGMPEDTWALNENRIEEDVFLDLTHEIERERVRIYKHELKRLRSGILVAVFVSSDRIQHMFWRAVDPEHPLYNQEIAQKYGDEILKVYQHMDGILGTTLRYLDDRTTLIVMSDHGFTNYRRSVNVNTWLIRSGFMKTNDPKRQETGEFFENVDFSGTVAYALGLNGIFLNLKGREEYGIVHPGEEADRIKGEIREKLVQLQDVDRSGEGAVKAVYDGADLYAGPYRENGPDLVVGYNRSYRASWQTALGAAPAELFMDNTKKWSGDHCTAPDLVPGILLSNRKIESDRPSILDIAPSILRLYGIQPEGGFDGKPIFETNSSH